MGLIFENGQWSLGPDSAGGADLDNIKNTYINLTDPIWTLQDLSPLAGGPAVQSVTHSGDINNIVFNAISAGSSNQITQAAYNLPRWYTPLKDNSGTSLTTSDNFQMTLKIEPQTATAPCSSCVMLGISESPTSIGAATMKTTGICLYRNDVNSTTGFLDQFRMGSNANTAAPIAGTVFASSGNFCQANITKIRGNTISVNALYTHNADNSDRNNSAYGAAANLYLTVAMFFRFNTDQALLNADEHWKLSYSLTKVT